MNNPETLEQIAYGTPRGRWVVTAAVLGTALAFLDATVVNVALPNIGQDLDATLGDLQWTVTGYMLTLSAWILTGGALGDRYGRRRIFIVGTVWFAAASLLCGIAPNVPTLVAARAFQGIGGALLTPASLAIIEASFRKEDRGRAIGAWSGLGGVAAAVGPFVGGYLLSIATWRVIFLINIPMAAAIVWVTLRHVPESMDPRAPRQPDIAGAALGALGLGGVVYALIRASEGGFGQPVVWVTLAVGVIALISFGVAEVRGKHPMLPLDIFSSRQFTGANLVTFVVYAALGGIFFLLVMNLQQAVGYSPLEAGVATLPVT
ncbi:MAG TPA: MFS transporter, partial [Actinomycetota bacterium]|nr:MFS transporter [Actinomycetota bacterium]